MERILMAVFLRALLVSLLCHEGLAVCSEQLTCGTCLNTGVEGEKCFWCPLSRECYQDGSEGEPCPKELQISQPQNCSVDQPTDYNETAAFHHLLLSAVTYSDRPDECLAKIKEIHPSFDYEILGGNFIARRCDDFYFDYKVCASLITVSHVNRDIAISYRGTSQKLQLLDEALATISLPKVSYGSGTVHQYFHNAYNKLQGCVQERLRLLIDSYPIYTVTVSGHSLGGAVASLMSFSLAENLPTELYTYGMPRVGSKTFAVEHDKLVPNSWRLVHHRDLVPLIPRCGSKCDSGDGNTNYHHGHEVFYDDETMNPGSQYILCRANHDNSCSRKYSNFFSSQSTISYPWRLWTGLQNHLDYFNIPVGSYCDSLLGVGKRKKRSLARHLQNALSSETCSALYKFEGVWMPNVTVNHTWDTVTDGGSKASAFTASAVWLFLCTLSSMILVS